MAVRRNKRITVVILVGVFLVLAVCFVLRTKQGSLWPAARIELDSGYHEVMGTFARAVVVAMDKETAQKCTRAALEQIEMVDDLMSDYKQDSQISRVNRDAFKQPVKVDKDTFEVLQKSIEFSALSGGAFDVTVGPLVDLWRCAAEANSAPTEAELQRAHATVGYEKLILDANDLTVRFSVEAMRLDLGAIAKGYAIDKAVAAMQTAGAIGGMVDIGGDIRCFGAPPPGKDRWLIGLQDPGKTGDLLGAAEPLLVLKLTNAAIATSGDYRRFALIQGKKYSHIIDVGTGGAGSELSSVTIISGSATDADALATAVSVMGARKGLALIEKLPRTEAILIPSPRHKFFKTSGAEKYIEY